MYFNFVKIKNLLNFYKNEFQKFIYLSNKKLAKILPAILLSLFCFRLHIPLVLVVINTDPGTLEY